LRPQTLRIASFDAPAHHGQSGLVRRFALPRALFGDRLKHCGFHGLSYKYIYIAARLAALAPNFAKARRRGASRQRRQPLRAERRREPRN
jgi:acetate kinase